MVKKSSQTYAEFSSGLQLYGVISQVLKDSVGNIFYLRSQGASSIAYAGKELLGHGEDVHAEGFGSPVGLIRGFSNCLSTYSLVELDQFGVCLGRDVRLEFQSGIQVAGVLKHVERQQNKNIILSFDNCTVINGAGEVLFDPDWGCYDMAIGAEVRFNI